VQEELAMFRRICTRTAAVAALAAVASIGGATRAHAQKTYDWYRPSGTTCSTTDISAAKSVMIKSDMYNPKTMISPDSAKLIALCAVPGQIGSGEMNLTDGITEYAIDIIPDKKKTHTKVIVNAHTGAVLSTKQFGGVRGFVGWIKESSDHKQNSKP
jgi:uncharacterized membrane protein YkoI